MVDYTSDSQNQSAPAGQGHNQRTPSAAHNKRNNRNRKNNPQFDGTVSDGAVAHPASPHSKKTQSYAHQQRQSVHVASTGSVPIPQNNNMGRANGQKPRPVSVGANFIHNTPAKEQAYAASAFQASPAPSSLPMPKFLSKSIPDNAVTPSLQGHQAAPDNTQNGHGSSPESAQVSPAPPPREAQQSPLDLFFKADRAEKERLRNGNATLRNGSYAPLSPPPSGNPFVQSGRRVFMRELDGDDVGMPSPPSVSQNNRPPNTRQHSSPAVPVRPTSTEQDRLAHTKALKDQLFNLASTPQRGSSNGQPGSQSPDGIFGSPSPFQRRTSGPSTPLPSSDQQQSQYSYNNRMNLSPLFQKARADTPPRQSYLRQEVPSDLVLNADSAVDVPPNPPVQSSVDPNTFARSYLAEQIRISGPAEMPQLPWASGPRPVQNQANFPSHSPVPIPVQPLHAQHGVPSSTTPRSSGAKDIKGMEDDLRRMLKINNVLG